MAAIQIADSIQQGFDSFFGFVPNLIAFLVILVIGYFVAKIVAAVVRKGLQKLGLDKALHQSDAGQYVERLSPGASPSSGVAKVVFYLLFAFVLTAAIGALKIPAVTAFMNQVLAYLPNVIAAIVIFVVAGAIAGAAAAAVAKLMGDTPTGKVVASVVPSLVMLIAIFMVLNQLQIAPQIVTITYLVLLGSVGLAMALSFGLGGRQVAADLLSDAYQKGQQQRGQVKRDMDVGRERAERQAERGKERARQEVGEGNGAGDDSGATGSGATGSGPGGSYRAER